MNLPKPKEPTPGDLDMIGLIVAIRKARPELDVTLHFYSNGLVWVDTQFPRYYFHRIDKPPVAVHFLRLILHKIRQEDKERLTDIRFRRFDDVLSGDEGVKRS